MRSFIYEDQDLINQLIKIGLNKNAQGLPAPESNLPKSQTEQQTQANASLIKLINGLQSHINPQREGVIYHEGDVTNRPSVNVTSLESLGDLIRFLSNNKIIMDGKRIAYDTDDPKPQGNDYKFYSPETHTYGEGMRGDAKKGFYINPELLKSYVAYLQSYNAKNPQPVMDMQLKGIVREINTSMNLGMDENYKEKDAPAFADNTVLDSVPKDFTGTSADFAEGPIKLNYGDVKDLNTFRGWLLKNQITTRSSNNKQATIKEPEFNECMVLGSLYGRSKLMARQPIEDEQQGAKIKAYQDQITIIGRQANCPALGGNGQQGQTGAANSDALISQIIDSPPLSQTEIDFGRINRFFSYLISLMTSAPIISQLKSKVENEMATVAQYMTNGASDTIFRLGAASDLGSMLKVQNQPKAFQTVVGLLGAIIGDTVSALEHFGGAYRNRDRNVDKFVTQQVGGGGYDTSSIYYGNKRIIDQWRDAPVSTK